MLETTQALSTLHTGKVPEYLKEELEVKIQIPNEDSLEVTVRTEQFCTGLFKIYYSWDKKVSLKKGQVTQLTLKKVLKAPVIKCISFNEHTHTFKAKYDFSYIANEPLYVNINNQPIYAEFTFLTKSNSQDISKIQGIFISLDNKDLRPKNWNDFSLKVLKKAYKQTLEKRLRQLNDARLDIDFEKYKQQSELEANWKKFNDTCSEIHEDLNTISKGFKKHQKKVKTAKAILYALATIAALYLTYKGIRYGYQKANNWFVKPALS